MGEAAQMALLLGALGALGLLFGWALLVQRRQLNSGTKLCSVRLLRDAGKLVATARPSISRPGRLCRLLLALRTEGRYEEKRWRFLRGRVALVTGTAYALRIADRAGEVLYQESGDLARFRAWLWGSESNWGLSRERSRWTHRGRVALLEFVPRQCGVHEVALEIEARTEDTTEWSSSSYEVLEAELTVAEGVEPLWNSERYPHRRIQL